MSPKLKKAIIVVVVFLLVGIVALVAVSMLSNISTTTVYDLRLVDATTEEELFEKDVYLTAVSKNNFDIKIESDTSSLLNYVVTSSNVAVATVAKQENVYKVSYHSTGKAIISVMPAESDVVKDSFVLNVKENIPNSFAIIDAEADSANEVTIYADDRDYRFDFQAKKGTISENINLSQMVVVKDYNQDVFDDIYVDDATSQLVINAKQSEGSAREYITLQAKHKDGAGLVTTDTFAVCVNVLGNYIADIQLMLNEDPNFDASGNIYGSGIIKDGEQKIQNVYLSADISAIYAKIRVVYTNGQFKDVTGDNHSGAQSSFGEATELLRLGNYYKIVVPTGVESVTVKFWHDKKEENLTFYYLGEKTSSAYINKVNSFYERYTEENGAKVYYKYTYWDQRFMRNDAITDSEGRIVGFAGGNPTSVSE